MTDEEDPLRELYRERFHRHREWRSPERERAVGDYPPVTEQEAARHRREAVEAFYNTKINDEETTE